MNKKQLSLFLLLAIIPFALYLFSDRFVDPDSYYYLNVVCNNGNLNENGFFNIFLPFIPCNFFVIKFLLVMAYFGILFFTAKLGELFDKQNGWLLAIILVGLTLFPTEVWKFENDMFGYFFGFASLYFFTKHYLARGYFSFFGKDFFIGSFLLVLAGLFWNGMVYWLIPLALLNFFGIFLFFGSIFLFLESYFNFLSQSTLVLENQVWIGFVYLGLSSLFLIGIVKSKRFVVASYLLMVLILVFQAKLFVLGIPFACLIAFEGLKILSNSIPMALRKGFKIFTTKERVWETTKQTLIILAILTSLFWSVTAINQFPKEDDVLLIKNGIELSPSHIENDFSAGYVIRYYGGNPSCAGWLCEYKYEGIVINIVDTNSNCVLLEKSTNLQLLKC